MSAEHQSAAPSKPKPDGAAVGGAPAMGGGKRGVLDFSWQFWFALLLLALLFVVIGGVYFWVLSLSEVPVWVPLLMSALWLVAGIGGFVLLFRAWRQFRQFGDDLARWSEHLRQGDLAARMPLAEPGCLSSRTRQRINAITDDYQAAAQAQHQREEARTLSVMEERTRMAHELHDSLAQTLASLRIKIRLFDDSLHKGDEAVIWQELEALAHTIDDAYAELRSLITDFRAPIDGKGVVRSVRRLAERFKRETGLEMFFYHNWALEDLDEETELAVVRIVQEALNNVRKHSQADTVRILMYSSDAGRCSVLVEDDGIGLPDKPVLPDPLTGEHIGMRIMQERAAKLCGELQYESDPDEGGTLLQLSFDVVRAS